MYRYCNDKIVVVSVCFVRHFTIVYRYCNDKIVVVSVCFVRHFTIVMLPSTCFLAAGLYYMRVTFMLLYYIAAIKTGYLCKYRSSSNLS